jgi:hypothetical protein
VKRVLLVAFHFPPLGTSSGLHRTLSLAKHLPRYGWEPIVLTASTRAHPDIGPESSALAPDCIVHRAFALDTARHLAIAGRYPRALALPDRWITWLLGGAPAGFRLIRRYRPQLIWTTYPLATAHLIGDALHKATKLPWLADFRDPMVECIDGRWFPADERVRNARLSVERRVAAAAVATTFCTDTALRIFGERHAGCAGRARVIENGYDAESFEAAAAMPARPLADRIHLVHSGTLYPGPDRDPSGLFTAMAALRARGRLSERLRVTLRATGFDGTYRPMIERLGLSDVVRLEPPVDYASALREMLDADGLLLFQGHTSNPAIPAKAYEYLRARRPILALAAGDGETAKLLRRANAGVIAPIDDAARIEVDLERFLEEVEAGTHRLLSDAESERYARIHRVAEFAALFDEVASPA